MVAAFLGVEQKVFFLGFFYKARTSLFKVQKCWTKKAAAAAGVEKGQGIGTHGALRRLLFFLSGLGDNVFWGQ